MTAKFVITADEPGTVTVQIPPAAMRALRSEFVHNYTSRADLLRDLKHDDPDEAEERCDVWQVLHDVEKRGHAFPLTLAEGLLERLAYEVNHVCWLVAEADCDEKPDYSAAKGLRRTMTAITHWLAGRQWDHREADYSFEYGWEGGTTRAVAVSA